MEFYYLDDSSFSDILNNFTIDDISSLINLYNEILTDKRYSNNMINLTKNKIQQLIQDFLNESLDVDEELEEEDGYDYETNMEGFDEYVQYKSDIIANFYNEQTDYVKMYIINFLLNNYNNPDYFIAFLSLIDFISKDDFNNIYLSDEIYEYLNEKNYKYMGLDKLLRKKLAEMSYNDANNLHKSFQILDMNKIDNEYIWADFLDSIENIIKQNDVSYEKLLNIYNILIKNYQFYPNTNIVISNYAFFKNKLKSLRNKK